MGIYNLLITINTVGIAFIIVINYKIRKAQKGRGAWRND
jgi:hypothetical protein